MQVFYLILRFTSTFSNSAMRTKVTRLGYLSKMKRDTFGNEYINAITMLPGILSNTSNGLEKILASFHK